MPALRADAQLAVFSAPATANRAFAIRLVLSFQHAAALAEAFNQVKTALAFTRRTFAALIVFAPKFVELVRGRDGDGSHESLQWGSRWRMCPPSPCYMQP